MLLWTRHLVAQSHPGVVKKKPVVTNGEGCIEGCSREGGLGPLENGRGEWGENAGSSGRGEEIVVEIELGERVCFISDKAWGEDPGVPCTKGTPDKRKRVLLSILAKFVFSLLCGRVFHLN